MHERLIAMQAAGANEAERQVYLGLTSALEDGLRRSLEEAVSTFKTTRVRTGRRGCSGGWMGWVVECLVSSTA